MPRNKERTYWIPRAWPQGGSCKAWHSFSGEEPQTLENAEGALRGNPCHLRKSKCRGKLTVYSVTRGQQNYDRHQVSQPCSLEYSFGQFSPWGQIHLLLGGCWGGLTDSPRPLTSTYPKIVILFCWGGGGRILFSCNYWTCVTIKVHLQYLVWLAPSPLESCNVVFIKR